MQLKDWLSVKRFFAHFLFILAAWTLVIKYILPVILATVADQSITTYIYWDLWWVVHIWLGCALIFEFRYLRSAALLISIIEIGIIAIKFTNFLSEPQWTPASMNWFVNKIFVLACFVLLLIHVLLRGETYRRKFFG